MKKKKYCPYQDTDYVGWDEIKVEICPIQKQITEEIEYCYYDDDYKHCPIYVLQQKLQRKDNIINELKELLKNPYNQDCINQNNDFLDKMEEIENGK